MNTALVLWLAVCIIGFALSLKSIAVLRGRSACTIAGWAFTALYFAIAAADAARATPAPYHADYVALALLTIAFIAAARRDEPQAEPWYNPKAPGPTGAERTSARPSK